MDPIKQYIYSFIQTMVYSTVMATFSMSPVRNGVTVANFLSMSTGIWFTVENTGALID